MHVRAYRYAYTYIYIYIMFVRGQTFLSHPETLDLFTLCRSVASLTLQSFWEKKREGEGGNERKKSNLPFPCSTNTRRNRKSSFCDLKIYDNSFFNTTRERWLTVLAQKVVVVVGGGGELIIVFSFSPIKYDQELWNTGKYISLHIVRYIDKYSLK